VNDPLIARFAQACGAAHPLNLRVGLGDGGVLAEGSVQQPFTLIGRDDACDVTLNDPEVNPRHAWFQVVGGRVYTLDLGSRNGLAWPDGSKRSGWLDPQTPVRVGPFHLQLRSGVSDRTGPGERDPLVADPDAARKFPIVQLDFRNGKRAKDRWTVNRPLTLVGRSDACKLHLQADDISSFHCGLVLTPAGLWVVDLSARGVVVNGERMRVAPLNHGAELWVGRFLIGCHYPALGDTPCAGRASHSSTHVKGQGKKSVPPPPIAEDEVPLGGMPVNDPASGLPSSHILCDAFAIPSSSGPISAPIFVSGTSGALPPNMPIPVPPQPRPTVPPPPSLPELPAHTSLAPLLEQLSDLHAQMLDQFQHSLVLMAKLVSRSPSADSRVLQQELTRIQEVNAELAKLQGEVTRQTFAGLAPSDQTPLPGAAPIGLRTRTPLPAEAIQEWVETRIGALQNERRHRWDKLRSLVGGG
jgi:pSer/pThr/pTyr-binding forkhead associated (FHA) protein